ncbi:MAG: DUF2752 domain-containing protein [Oscillospiraceae bacterium]|nr:DUF2752 domain-containing protein [Oscillospiraceae bacterium]
MSRKTRIIISLIIPFTVAFAAVFVDIIVRVLSIAGDCNLYSLTGILCPACGGTRAMAFLLRGNILAALRYNIWVVFIALLGIALYIEFVLKLFNVNVKLVPRSRFFIYITLCVFITYSILRNFIPLLKIL